LMLLHAGLHITFIARAYFFDTGFDRLRQYAITGLFSLPFLTPDMREVFLNASGSGLASPRRLWIELTAVAVALGAMLVLYLRHDLLRRGEALLIANRTPILRAVFVGLLLLSSLCFVGEELIFICENPDGVTEKLKIVYEDKYSASHIYQPGWYPASVSLA
ncbi:MAG: hypothetical protein HC880_03840, partial [Bacteroidia bacterium]|nr:hypothetical protein [Bacteroidia bacterium]